MHIGVDIGGTEIKAGLVDNGKILRYASASTLRSVSMIVDSIIKIIKELWQDDVTSIGIGFPGVVHNGIVSGGGNLQWPSIDISKRIHAVFGVPVSVINDAHAFTKGARDFYLLDSFAGITLGTGLGFGLVKDNMLIDVPEINKIPYKDADFESYCSSHFFRDDPKKLLDFSKNGDLKALRIFEDFGMHLSHVLLHVHATYGVDTFVLGGSLCNAHEYFDASLQQNLLLAKFQPKIIYTTKAFGILGAL
ncbi:MAG: ROK family protein [Candidatus Woesearchaeota archaeon]